MENARHDKDLERRIMRSYVWMLCAPRTIDSEKVVSLFRRGPYDVRLIEPPEEPASADVQPFWVELFDNRRNISIDSYEGHDIEEAAVAVQYLIDQAELLDQGSAA